MLSCALVNSLGSKCHCSPPQNLETRGFKKMSKEVTKCYRIEEPCCEWHGLLSKMIYLAFQLLPPRLFSAPPFLITGRINRTKKRNDQNNVVTFLHAQGRKLLQFYREDLTTPFTHPSKTWESEPTSRDATGPTEFILIKVHPSKPCNILVISEISVAKPAETLSSLSNLLS